MSIAHLYRITNKVTGEYYLGKHNGVDQNGYWGSGERIKRQVKKHGTENFAYKILVIGNTDYIFELEKKIVTVDLIESDNKCLNLVGGGYGTSQHTKEHKEKLSKISKIIFSNPIMREKLSKSIRKAYENPKIREKNRLAILKDRAENPEKWKEAAKKTGLAKKGILFSEEHKEKLSNANKGKLPWNKGKTNTISEEGILALQSKCGLSTKNSVWINNGEMNKRVKPEILNELLSSGWNTGRITSYIDDKYRNKMRIEE
jgi:hypothetical protein